MFSHRPLVIGLFIAVTAFMGYSTTRLTIDAGYTKQLPLQHEYMQTFTEYRQEFGGANRVLIALTANNGDMFTPEFFGALELATNQVFFVTGVDRTRVRSLFTPNVRYTEVVEDGIAAGNVVPSNFHNDSAGIAQVRKNILKAGIVGRLVANDFSGALISAELLDTNPTTGETLDYIAVGRELENDIRARVENSEFGDDVDVHIIGFAKAISDVSQGAGQVVLFFVVALIVMALLVVLYAQSLKLALIPLTCSLIAVVWQLGSLTRLGFGIDPMGMLVPFLILAIGVSHGVQMISAISARVLYGVDSEPAARESFCRLLLPGGIALVSDTIGFVTILLIDVQVIQEMAITASLGVAAIILTNLILLPVVASYLTFDAAHRDKLRDRSRRLAPIWRNLARVSQPGPAALVIAVAVSLLLVGAWKASDVKIGDLHVGVPELRPDSRYNMDSKTISDRFSIGADVITVIAETTEEGCIDSTVMRNIDRFTGHMQTVPGVQSAVSLTEVAKRLNSGWNEGNLKWRALPRNQSLLVQSIAYIPTSSGLLNEDCSVMPVILFAEDHKAQTISTIVTAVKEFVREHSIDTVRFRLATGNVGVMAATNEVVDAAQFPILMGVFSAIITLCLVTFRSVRAVVCIVAPLGLVSVLAYALMSVLEIGLKVSILPIVALGVGVGVDYGIYIFDRFNRLISEGESIPNAYVATLASTGGGVVFTAITLAIGVGTWIFSTLQFQADMGILLTFMFLVNMLAAILLIPALASFLFKSQSADSLTRSEPAQPLDLRA